MALERIRLDQVQASTSSYDTFGDQLEALKSPFYQEFSATQGQTVFTLSTNYVVGNNGLKVFLNGIYQDVNVDYTETSFNQVTFSQGLDLGDWVLFRIEGAGSGTTLEDHKHIIREIPFGAINGTNNTFTTQFVPRLGSEEVYRNGVLQTRGSTNDYQINGNTIVFLSAPSVHSIILVNYIVG
jgi:hypothetical protein